MNKKSESQKNQRIQVFARCRPLNQNETKQYSPSVVEVIPDKKILVKDRSSSREFFFDKVFPPNTKQISVYKAVVGPLIQEVLMGYNCTVFAYGQTGTGKTYTMEGERNDVKCSWEDDPGAGIIPRSLHQLFEDLNKEENVEFSVRVSFLELYNEELFDLLSSNELSKLRLFEDVVRKGSVIIQGLEEIIVNNKDEVYSILEKGSARRQTAATMLNASSSRSHTVFSVTVHIKENTIEGEELLKTGKLNLVDLAGSENVGRSGAIDKRAREAGNINQSLLTLGRVITALIEKQPHVPYRESKLTRLLQDSLGGHTKTSIIATISPALCNLDETISTLDYATKAKSITIKPEVNQKMTKRALIREYAEEIERLQKDLAAVRSKEGFYIDMENYMRLNNEIIEKKDMIKDLTDKIDFLKTEIAKVEENFNTTKEQLTVTSEKLNESSRKCKVTAAELSNTKDALNHTKMVLSETTLERDENKFIIGIQSNTEKKLSQQAQKLLHVADEVTTDAEKLHAKIKRKDYVEKTNEDKFHEFRNAYQKKFAMLDDMVSYSEKEQTDKLSNIKEYKDKVMVFLQTFQQQNTDFLNEFVSTLLSKMENASTYIASKDNSQTKWSTAFLEKNNCKKESLSNELLSFLSKKLPELMDEMNLRNSEMKKWVQRVQEILSGEIEKEKLVLSQNSERRKELISSTQNSFKSLCESYEEAVKNYKLQVSAISLNEDNLEKEYSKKLQILEQSIASSLQTLSSIKVLDEHRKETRKSNYQLGNTLVSKLESNHLTMQEIEQPLNCLYIMEDQQQKEGIVALDKLPCIVDIQEFSAKQDIVFQSGQKTISELEKIIKEYREGVEDVFVANEASLKHQLSSLTEHQLSIEKIISEVNSSIENCAKLGKVLHEEHTQKVVEISHKIEKTLTESKKSLSSNGSKIKEEILKSDIEFEKFISEDLLKDIPTGTTPQRKDYSYPKMLAATSPHERILHRFRSQLAADTAVAINLPLDSSFNELDELKTSPVSDHCSDAPDLHNISFSSDDSTTFDTDSCASMSDASIDSGRNKENRKNSKKSRLPKRLPGSKVFIKPAPPSNRKPLVSANPAVTEQSNS